MSKKGKGSKKKKDDEKKKKRKKKKDDTHTSKEPSVMVSNPPTAVPMKKFMVLYMASGLEFERMRQNSTPEQRRKTNGWGTWIRTKTGGVRVRCPTVRRSPIIFTYNSKRWVLQYLPDFTVGSGRVHSERSLSVRPSSRPIAALARRF